MTPAIVNGVLVRLALPLLLVGCGFNVPANGIPIDASGAEGGGSNGEGGMGTEAGDTCFGTSQLATICLVTLPMQPRTFAAETIIQTQAGNAECATLGAGSSDVCVIAATGITITPNTRVAGTGPRPLVLLATTEGITIGGTLEVASKKNGLIGAGADIDCNAGQNPPATNGGGQGGSFGSNGGDGGNSNGATDKGIHGAIIDPTKLRGGCKGADGGGSPATLGHGGGAILLIAPQIAISISGSINASGAAGLAAVGTKHSGGGAGSGGMIVLDSPSIANAGAIFANGAGGGGGSGNGAGGDGADPIAVGGAAGGPKGSQAGDGGAGSVGAANAMNGGNGMNSTDGGGGGGGGAGVIEVYQFSGSIGGTVSPPASN